MNEYLKLRCWIYLPNSHGCIENCTANFGHSGEGIPEKCGEIFCVSRYFRLIGTTRKGLFFFLSVFLPYKIGCRVSLNFKHIQLRADAYVRLPLYDVQLLKKNYFEPRRHGLKVLLHSSLSAIEMDMSWDFYISCFYASS